MLYGSGLGLVSDSPEQRIAFLNCLLLRSPKGSHFTV